MQRIVCFFVPFLCLMAVVLFSFCGCYLNEAVGIEQAEINESGERVRGRD